MSYPNYLIHFNKNHSSSTGQFISGDGDGDGVVNDHSHRSGNGSSEKVMSRQKARRIRNAGISLCAASAGLHVANIASAYAGVGDDWVHATALGMSAAGLIVGATQTVRGAVSMGKASRRGDNS